jgi:hypothetical protein
MTIAFCGSTPAGSFGGWAKAGSANNSAAATASTRIMMSPVTEIRLAADR